MAAVRGVRRDAGGSLGLGRGDPSSSARARGRPRRRTTRARRPATRFEEIPAPAASDGIAVQAACRSPKAARARPSRRAAEAHDSPVGVLVNNAGITRDTLAMRMRAEAVGGGDRLQRERRLLLDAGAAGDDPLASHRADVNIASVVGEIGNIGQATYAAAKRGVIGMTMTMARELAGRDKATPSRRALRVGLPESCRRNVAGVMKNIPAGRFGKPEEVAGLVKYLALDPSAAYITGHCLNIAGGTRAARAKPSSKVLVGAISAPPRVACGTTICAFDHSLRARAPARPGGTAARAVSR